MGNAFQIWFNDLRHLGNFRKLVFDLFELGFTWASWISGKLDIEEALYCLKDSLVWQRDEELTNLQHLIFHSAGKNDLKFLVEPHKSAFSFHLSILKISLIWPQLGLELSRARYLAILEGTSVGVFIWEDMSTFDELASLKIAFLYLTIYKLLHALAFTNTNIFL